MSDIHTWADGYGLWHASVPDVPNAARTAKRAIMRKLRERESNVSARRVRLRQVDKADGAVHYVEEAD